MVGTFRRIHRIGVVLLLSSLLHYSLAVNEDECTDVCSESSTSNITLSEISISNATVTWSESFGTEDPFFIVKHRERNSGIFESSEVITVSMYTIQGLDSSTNYEVQVCLANATNECGGCLKCFATSMRVGLPSIPRNVMVTSSGPRMITVVWDTPDFIGGGIIDYTLYFGTNQLNLTNVQLNVDARLATISTNILPNTTYFVAVSARSLLGNGEESEPVSITTDQFSTVPGIFLVALQDKLIYYSVVDETFFDNNFQIGNQMDLADLSTTIIDISYDYRRGYIYASTTNNSIVRYNVTITDPGNSDLTLTQTGFEELYSDLSNVGSISVDWVNDRIFWVEHVDSTSQVRSGPLNGGATMTHGASLSGLMNSLTADPIQGYFYWVIEGSLVKLNYSRVITADETTNLAPFQFMIASATSFALDLADSQYYYISDETTTVRRGLGDNFISESGAIGVVPALRTSFGERVVLTLTTAPDSIFFRDASTGSFGDFIFLNDVVSEAIVLRSSFQPLPVPPGPVTNIRVLAETYTVNISWDATEFTSSIFGPDAFRDWEYSVEYSPVGSSKILTFVTKATTASLPSLTSGTTYTFTITTMGITENEAVVTPDTYFFSTFGSTNIPKLLVTSNEGVLLVDTNGESSRFLANPRIDLSSGATSNSHFNRFYAFTSSGEFHTESGLVKGLERPNDPAFLQLDWITRQLYWVEQQSSRIYRVPTTDLSSSDLASMVELVESEDASTISGLALDALNGVLFWITETGIFAKPLNNLESTRECYTFPNLEAITVDSVNSRLFVAYFMGQELRVATLDYTTFTCDESSFISRSVQDIELSSTNLISIAYGTNTLYLAQYSQLEVKSISAEFASVTSDQLFALGSIAIEGPDNIILNNLRALSVVVIDNQPLPDGLTGNITGNVGQLTPFPSGPAFLNEVTSNTTFIDITWEPSNFTFSDVYYQLEISLTPALESLQRSFVMENVLTGNSYQLTNQSFSTLVEVNVTAYSVWFSSQPVQSSFFSTAALPAQVQNVRVYVFQPIRNVTSIVTAQVVWDGLSVVEAGGMLTGYSIDILRTSDMSPITSSNVLGFEDGWNGPPFVVGGDSTEFTVVLSGIGRRVFYPLRIDTDYTVMVSAMNSAGEGIPSEVVTFNTNEPHPPQEVLVSSPSGGSIVNSNGETYLGEVTPPITINNANRTLYYYNDASHALFRRSLDSTIKARMLTIFTEELTPLAFTFDWVTQTVYVLGRNSRSNALQLWTVFDMMPEPILQATLLENVPEGVEIKAVINPYRGFLQWTQFYQSTNITNLYQLNLRNMGVVSLLSSSNKRSLDINSLQISRALTFDPFTEELWLSDSSTGDIINCNVSMSGLTQCVVVVNAIDIGGAAAGLPADQLAIDENTVYWSQSQSNVIYYINRTEPQNLQTFTTSLNEFVILGISPGQQPLPDTTIDNNVLSFPPQDSDAVYCYSPDFIDVTNRPVPKLVAKTNTTFDLTWATASIPAACEDVVFSFLPLTYTVKQLEGSSVNKMEFTVFNNMILLTNLEPYTVYTISIESRNQYSILPRDFNSLFGEEREYRTREGIPTPLNELRTISYGPENVYVYWDSLNQADLRGNTDNQTFNVFINDVMAITQTAATFANFDELASNAAHNVSVSVHNGDLTSDVNTVKVNTLAPPPMPVIESSNSFDFSFSVTLTYKHSNISSINVIVPGVGVYPYDVSSDLTSSVNSNVSFIQTVRDLRPFTNYTVLVEGLYRSYNVNDVTLGPVIANGTAISIRTETAAPDAPLLIKNESNMIAWVTPNNNGEEIDKYILRYIDERTPDAASGTARDITAPANSFNLDTLNVAVDNTYLITLVAVNRRGNSDESNQVMYEPTQQTEFYESIYFIGGVAGGGGLLLILIFFLLLIICCCCCCAPPDKRGSFRPDYELIRLREEYAKTRQHAFNPNYMWTRDDYTAYQDDLDNMNKFPRNKLRLENFIDRGEFGEVYQGTAIDILAVDSGPTPVAVKTMRKGSSHDEKEKFLSEAALMSNFNHQNIVKVLGVCIDNEPVYIIMELMPAGDLLKFLREARRESGPPLLTLAEQVQLAIDVGQGCRYLEQQHFIHRDIAARNCLVSSKGADRVVKIGDFGLAKDLYTSDYYQVEGQRKLPVRWMAPEALLQGKFTIETDIWSYGVLLWELFTFGNQPYPGRNNQEVLQFVTGGGRLEKPENCSIRVYKLMQVCWETSPSERLHFAQIVEYMAHYLEHVNNKRDSYFSEDEEEEGEDGDLTRKSSRPSRNSSVRSVGLINLARQGSVRIRRSIRGRSSLKKEDFEGTGQNHTGLNSEENLVDDDKAFRERGPF